LGQTWSRCNNGPDCFGAVKYVEKLLGPAKTGCIALPEYLVAPLYHSTTTPATLRIQGGILKFFLLLMIRPVIIELAEAEIFTVDLQTLLHWK